MGPGGAGSSGALGWGLLGTPEPSWVMTFAHAAALGGVDLSPDPLTLLRRGLQGGRALPWTQGCRPVPACF